MTQVDGQVVAFGVLDIVPTGVSSVYFCYDPASPLSSDVKWGKVCLMFARRDQDVFADSSLPCWSARSALFVKSPLFRICMLQDLPASYTST